MLGLALLLEWGLGDPANRWHPVAWFGRWATFCERRVYADSLLRGVLCWLAAVGFAMTLAYLLHAWAGMVRWAFRRTRRAGSACTGSAVTGRIEGRRFMAGFRAQRLQSSSARKTGMDADRSRGCGMRKCGLLSVDVCKGEYPWINR